MKQVKLVLGSAALGLGFAFIRYFNHWVYFPVFPDFLDSMIMIGIGFVLVYESIKEDSVQRLNKNRHQLVKTEPT